MRWGGRVGAGLLMAFVGCGGDGAAGTGSGTEGATESPPPATTGTPATTSGGSSSGGVEPATSEAGSSSGEPPGSSSEGGDESSTGPGHEAGPFEACYEGVFVNGYPGVNYDGLDLPIGEHCLGTNFQDILEVDRVVFLGDSV
ncbi:MAG: hypothetical protein KUG77_15880, partial [Nannocystaceae bacterium]|nr:hypothetical protein [Nannocystaceae bacterium]